MRLLVLLVLAAALAQCTVAFLPPSCTQTQLAARRQQHQHQPATCSPREAARQQAQRQHQPLRALEDSKELEPEEVDDPTDFAEAKIVVQGQAYGGYFRAHARNEAHFNRRLAGALQEYPDRTEIIVEGRRGAIDSFVRWCKRGPGLGQQIRDVEVTFTEYVGIFEGFRVIPFDHSAGGQPTASAKNAGVP